MEASGAEPKTEPRALLTTKEVEIAFNRVVAFTDGVFAIAITLLVLALEVPEDASSVGQELVDQGDNFIAYLLSFAVLGKLWLSHHRFFAGLGRFDGPLMALNLFYLAAVALVPFTSELLGDYGNESVAAAVYAANLAAISGAFYAQIVYAFRNGLMREKWQPFERRFAGPANFTVTALFLLSIPVALLSPAAAICIWVASFFFGRRTVDRVTGIDTIEGPAD